MHSKASFSSLTIFQDDNDNDHINVVRKVLDLPSLPGKLNMNIENAFRSHCNGIICLMFKRIVMLCNPAIKECRVLQKPCLPYSTIIVGVGFGYDSRANDYKVVKFGFIPYPPREFRAEVYSMRTDSWREVAINLKVQRLFHQKEVFCKGVFYWSTWNHILSFDLSDEVFYSLPLPNSLNVIPVEKIKLALWNNSVALLVYNSVRGVVSKSIQVWMMENCSGNNTSWIKKLTISPLVDIETPLTFWKNGELLMKTANGELISYNVQSQMFRHLIFIQETDNTELIWDYSYMKSLVSVRSSFHSKSHRDRVYVTN